MGESSQNLDTARFREGNWKVTGAVLVLRILEAGVPGGLYLVRDHELWNTEAGDGNEPISLLTPDLDWSTLLEVTNMDHRDLRPYNGIYVAEKPAVIKLRVLSTSKLEIVRTGVKEEWSDGHPPIGLYPFKQDMESG